MLGLRKPRTDPEYQSRFRSLPALVDTQSITIKRDALNSACGQPLPPKHVTSTFDVRPINTRDFNVSGVVAITSNGGVASALFTFPVPQGYTFVGRTVSHDIHPALVNYPTNALTAGKGILTTLLIDKSPVPNFGNMNFSQSVHNEPIYFIAAGDRLVGYALSINEDTAGQFNGLAFYVKLTGNLLLSSDYPIHEQIGSECTNV